MMSSSFHYMVLQLNEGVTELANRQFPRRVATPESEPLRKKWSLSQISALVKEVVFHHTHLSYKEVSDMVLATLEKSLPRGDEYHRESKNIRRRVYDALNVLVAVDILERKGRGVLYKEKQGAVKTKLTPRWLEYGRRERVAAQLAQQCLVRQNMLKNVWQHYSCIHKLRKRNEAFETPILEENKFMFPIVIAMPSPNPTDTMRVFIEESPGKQIKLNIFGKDVKIFTDSSTIQFLDIPEDEDDKELRSAVNKLLAEKIVILKVQTEENKKT